MTTTNLDSKAFNLTQALHTYFRVAILRLLNHIQGLAGVDYQDRSEAGNEPTAHAQQGAISIQGELDRVYAACPEVIYLTDGLLLREIRIHGTDSQSTVVWNPWQVALASKWQIYPMMPINGIETVMRGRMSIGAPQANHALSAAPTAWYSYNVEHLRRYV